MSLATLPDMFVIKTMSINMHLTHKNATKCKCSYRTNAEDILPYFMGGEYSRPISKCFPF